MKQKNSPLLPGNDISKRIIMLLQNKFGNDRLYKICSDLHFNQGGFRASLESPDAFRHAIRLFKIAEYFNVPLSWLMYGKKLPANSNLQFKLQKENIKIKEENKKLREFIRKNI